MDLIKFLPVAKTVLFCQLACPEDHRQLLSFTFFQNSRELKGLQYDVRTLAGTTDTEQ